jgi:hypothetical protein
MKRKETIKKFFVFFFCFAVFSLTETYGAVILFQLCLLLSSSPPPLSVLDARTFSIFALEG